jgi:2-methylaconitate cis-trans-isomerase PrpF
VHHRAAQPPDADVDYTFAQVEVSRPVVDYTGNCGNCSSSVGPFAIDEGLISAGTDGVAVVRIHNTNTKKIIVAHVPVTGGEAAVAGDFELPGVAGRGARIALDFVDSGGARTGKLLPTGRPIDTVDGLSASLVDATNPSSSCAPRTRPHRHRIAAGDGRRPRPRGAPRADPRRRGRDDGYPGQRRDAQGGRGGATGVVHGLDGIAYTGDQMDLVARVISMGNCHRAFALTAAMCLAVAARLEGTVVRECSTAPDNADVRLAHPSGVLPLDARVVSEGGRPHADRVTVYRTARRLMEGFVRVP